jgi:transcriptional regulator with XRE-family HTH domain
VAAQAHADHAGLTAAARDTFSDMDAEELVATLRRRHGLSQRALAVRARTSQAWVSRVERGEVSPSVESLERLLRVMGEELVLGAARIAHDDHDARHRAATAAMEPSERLERGLAAASFVAELHGRAR